MSRYHFPVLLNPVLSFLSQFFIRIMTTMYLFTFLITLQFIYLVHGLSFKAPISSFELGVGGHDNVRSPKRDQKPIGLGELHRNDRSTQLPITVRLLIYIP